MVVSCDVGGHVEYWKGSDYKIPDNDIVLFQFKSETDLYDFAKVLKFFLIYFFLIFR